VFPMVEIDGELHCDGGLRVNTPTAPAIHLGADKLFVIGLSCSDAGRDRPRLAAERAPGAPFLFGKVLDAFFLDHLDTDVRQIERVNEYLGMGETAFGSDFVARMNAEAERLGKPQRHAVQCAIVRPSVDLGRIAHDYLSQGRSKRGAENTIAHTLLRTIDVGEASEADLASFLLFDAGYTQILIELGRHDAALMQDELAAFFFG
jgi:NTE family protein